MGRLLGVGGWVWVELCRGECFEWRGWEGVSGVSGWVDAWVYIDLRIFLGGQAHVNWCMVEQVGMPLSSVRVPASLAELEYLTARKTGFSFDFLRKKNRTRSPMQSKGYFDT